MSFFSGSGTAIPALRKARVVPDKNKLAIRDLFGIDPEYLLSDSNIYTRTLQDTPVEERTGILPLITTPEREGGGGGEGGTRTGIDSLEPTFTRDEAPSELAMTSTSSQNLSDYLSSPALQAKYSTFGEYDKQVQSQMPKPNFIQRGISALRGAFQPKVQGTLGDRLQRQYEFARGIPSPIGILASARSPFNQDSPTYNRNLPAQLNALEAMGSGFIGRDPGTGGLKYGPKSVLAGKNVISGFGFNSPELALKDYIAKMKKNKKVTQAYKNKKIKMAEEELDKVTGGGDGGAKTKTAGFTAPTKSGQSPRGSKTGSNIPDRGRDRNPSRDHDGGASAAAQADREAGMGGY